MNDYKKQLELMVFSLGDTVRIKYSDELKGIINGILLSEAGIEYRVSIWDGNERNQHWVSACEIVK